MIPLRYLAAAIAAALAFSAAAQAGTHDFDQIVVFGDSLSDDGNLSLAGGATAPSRFTTNPGKVAVEHVADQYGLTLKPSLLGGSDFAFGGAGVLTNAPGTPAGVPTITDQVHAYLSAAGGMDGRTLYSMWGGANDIFYQATTATSTEAAQLAIATAATQELNLLGTMHAAGANYVMVFNLPDIGRTPSGTAAGAAGASGLSGLSLLYNGTLGAGLDALSAQGLNVVPVNVYALFNEVLADPAAFGFSNTSVPACLTGADTHAAGLTAVACGPEGSGAPYTYAPGTQDNYLFADGVHPTTAAHAMLGDYIIAELAAPGAASMLAEVPAASVRNHVDLLRNQMHQDSTGNGATRAFAAIGQSRQRFDATPDSPRTRSNDTNLALGVDLAAGDSVHLGVALGLARNNAHVGAGSFRSTAVLGSGYATYQRGGGYLNANIGFGQLSFNDITRRLQIGALQRVESGETAGSVVLGGLGGGWWFGDNTLRTGPFAHAQWQRIHVDGYSEDGMDSSAMWYGRQDRTSLVSTLGWQLEGRWRAGTSELEPFVRVAWNHDNRAEPRTVRAGLNGMQGSFALTGFIADDTWASADVGLAARFGESTRGWIAYRGQFGNDNLRIDSLNVGISIGF